MVLLAEGTFLWFLFDDLPSVIGVFIVIRVSDAGWWTLGVNLRNVGIFYVSRNCYSIESHFYDRNIGVS